MSFLTKRDLSPERGEDLKVLKVDDEWTGVTGYRLDTVKLQLRNTCNPYVTMELKIKQLVIPI